MVPTWGGSPTAIAKGDNGSCLGTYAIYPQTNLLFETNSGGGCGGNHYAWSTLLATSTWSQVGGVYDGTNMTTYLNGVPGTPLNISGTPPLVNSSPLWIGKGYSGGVQHWPGLIDDVRIYNRALSTAEILAIYNATK